MLNKLYENTCIIHLPCPYLKLFPKTKEAKTTHTHIRWLKNTYVCMYTHTYMAKIKQG